MKDTILGILALVGLLLMFGIALFGAKHSVRDHFTHDSCERLEDAHSKKD